MIINIKKEFENDFTSREAGERLRHLIIGCNNGVELDFLSLKIASASFFDEGIAKLSEENWTSEKLNSLVTIRNIFPRDLLLLQKVCKTRGLELESSIID